MFEWKELYATGIPSIDKQHKILLDTGENLRRLVSAPEQNLDMYDEIMTVIGELKAYTQYHFSYEEQLMEEFTFPSYEKHKRVHQDFLERVLSLEGEDIDLAQREVANELLKLLANWLIDHIMGEDRSYISYFQERNIQ